MDPLQCTVLKVKNDTDTALDEGDGIILVLLDLSTAFDTINHCILLKTARRVPRNMRKRTGLDQLSN